jgi:hypothetical protein
MPEHYIETIDAIAETRRSLTEMRDAMWDNEVMIALSKIALRESLELLHNASVALAGPYFRD